MNRKIWALESESLTQSDKTITRFLKQIFISPYFLLNSEIQFGGRVQEFYDSRGGILKITFSFPLIPIVKTNSIEQIHWFFFAYGWLMYMPQSANLSHANQSWAYSARLIILYHNGKMFRQHMPHTGTLYKLYLYHKQNQIFQ